MTAHATPVDLPACGPPAAEQALPGTAVRDAAITSAASAALCTALALTAGLSPLTVAGACAGIAVAAAASISLVRRRNRWSGPADRVTLARTVLIAGCATFTLPVLAGAQPARTWLLLALVAPALALDAVDGKVARRTATSSAPGARFDMEMDAVLLLVLSLIAARPLGGWVMAIGAMRYAFVAAGRLRPELRTPLTSHFGRAVAAIQGITLAAGLTPAVPLPLGRAAAAAALALLTVSFGRDVIRLESASAAQAAGRADRGLAPE